MAINVSVKSGGIAKNVDPDIDQKVKKASTPVAPTNAAPITLPATPPAKKK
jgi:hypothetical protein